MENSKPVVIKRSSEFLSLKKIGKRAWPTKWLLLNYTKVDQKGLHFGVTASRKVGSAVVRNKLKRWVKEYFRDFVTRSNQQGSPIDASINIIFKPIDQSFYKGLNFEEFKKAMDTGLEILRKST
ncbi:ribonuclease P protein component [Bdellovibrio sp. HCB337]|uniref:ribonuclease P protein component n=1 Tax=Bdellovibrio sp. HCB337 TaxID=3394358 RepID=UPI0039A43135